MRSRALAHSAALFLSTVLASALLAAGGVLAHARTPDTPATPSTGRSGHTGAVPPRPSSPPASIDDGAWRSGHLQGAAVDRRRGHMYFSCTDLLSSGLCILQESGTHTSSTRPVRAGLHPPESLLSGAHFA